MFKYVFRYNNQIVYETADSNEIDGFVDEWLEDNFSVLNEYSGYVLDKDNYDEYATNFKSQYIQEVE